MKRLLLLAFYFWPRNNIACHRSGCYAKYLPDFGWLPTVICEDWPEGSPDYDAGPLRHLPKEVAVHRIPQPRPTGIYEKVIARRNRCTGALNRFCFTTKRRHR